MLFAVECLGWTPWAKQAEIMRAVAHHLHTGGGTVAVGTGHHVGKSYAAAGLILWATTMFTDGITVVTTSAGDAQVRELWTKVRQQYGEARIDLGGHMIDKGFRYSDRCYALGRATNEPTRLQGYHNTRVLAIADEAAGIERKIFGAIDGIQTGHYDTTLMLGNTTADGIGGGFHDCFTGAREATTYNISTWDAVHADRTGASLRWCEEKLARWGEHDPEYMGRVMGEWPDASEHALISYGDVKRAIEREATAGPLDNVVIGLDVARFGEDRTCWAIRKGEDIIAIHQARQQDLVTTYEQTMAFVKSYGASVVVVDDTGLNGVTDMLQQLAKQNTVGVNFGAKAHNEDEYENRRAEIWFYLRDWFREGRGALLPNCSDRQLILDTQRDLVGTQYKFSKSRQRKQLESKEELKKRTAGQSPDIGDALALAYCVDSVGNPFSVAGDAEAAIDFWDMSWGGGGNREVL